MNLLLKVLICSGAALLLTGAALRYMAVSQMAQRLNWKNRHTAAIRWWDTLGSGSLAVVREYRRYGWKDLVPTKRFRLSTFVINAGIGFCLIAGLIEHQLKGSL